MQVLQLIPSMLQASDVAEHQIYSHLTVVAPYVVLVDMHPAQACEIFAANVKDLLIIHSCRTLRICLDDLFLFVLRPLGHPECSEGGFGV